MKVCLLLLLSVLASAYAHTYFSSITVDGRAYNEGECVKKHPIGTANFPIPLVTDADMTCGWRPLADQRTDKKCPVNPGSRVTIQWHYERATPNDMILDHSHKGPVLVYLAKSETGSGPVWFKIYEEGLINGNSNPRYWATDKLINNKGKLEFTIPADIAPGNYLLRGEIIALHSAYGVNGAQPYVGCAEITIGGSGSANPPGVSIPGIYKNSDPGIHVDIYNGISNYVIPGPAVYRSGSAPATTGSNPPPSQPTSAPVPSTPSSGLSVYSDYVGNPVFSDWSWASIRNPQDSKYVYSGSYSYSFVPQQWQGIFLACQGCIDTAKFDRIEFYVNGGDTGGQNVNLDLIKGGGSVSPSYSIASYTSSNIPARTWVKGSVPLSSFAAGQYDGLWFQDRNNNAQGTLYIDQITLVPKTRTGFAPSNNTIDDNSDNVENSSRGSTTKKTSISTLLISNIVTALVSMAVVAAVVVAAYTYRQRKTASAYNYKQFVENGQL